MKYVLLTQGQGAQFTLMGKDFHENFAVFRHVMEQAEDLTKLSIRKWIYEGTNEELAKTDKSQLAIFTTTMAIYSVLKEVNPEIEFESGIGLSLGEYSVLTIANCLNFAHAVEVVKLRGKIMQECAIKNPGKMAAVIGMEPIAIREHLVGSTSMANLNTPLQTVISGKKEDVDLSALALKQYGAKRVVDLDVSGAFHSNLMLDAYEEFKGVLDRATFRVPNFSIIMNATGEKETDPLSIKELLCKQLISSVQLVKSAHTAQTKNKFLELGPGTVVKGLIQKNIDAQVVSINTIKDLKEFELCAF